jgi:hypothetical protein
MSQTSLPGKRKSNFQVGKAQFRSSSELEEPEVSNRRYIPTLIRYRPKLTRKDVGKAHFHNATYHMDKVEKHMRAPKT